MADRPMIAVMEGRPIDAVLTPLGLSWSAERELVRQVQAGRERDSEHALGALLKAFRPFLGARIAEAMRPGVDIADLEQEARLGLVRAIERFDLARTTRLSSYADWWVRGHLRRFVARNRVIRIPERPGRELAQLRALIRENAEGFGVDPTLQELAQETGMTEERITELLQIPDGVVSLDELAYGEAATAAKTRPGGWARAAAMYVSDVEEEIHTDTYDSGEVSALIDEYQGLRSQLEIRTSAFEEPRLRRRGSQISNLVRLADVDRALQRVSGRQFVALELAGLRDLQLRKLETLLLVRYSTLADRKKAGMKWMCSWLNGHESEAAVRRRVYWRRLFAWNLGELLVHGEPVAFEVWARLGAAQGLWTGKRWIPVQAMEAFGEGWLLTPELLGRQVDWDTGEEMVDAIHAPAV